MPNTVCPMPAGVSPLDTLDAYNKAKKQMPGLTPAAWRKAAAQELGIDYKTFLTLWKQAKGKAPSKVKLVPESTPTLPATSAVKAVKAVETPPKLPSSAGQVSTPYGPLTHDLVKDAYKKMKADMPGATPATLRKAAAEYLGVDYNDFLKAWKQKPGAGPAHKPLLPNKSQPMSPTPVGKYANATDIKHDELLDELARLYGPGANKSYINLSRNANGWYEVQLPKSLLKTKALRDAVVDGLKQRGLKVERPSEYLVRIRAPKYKAPKVPKPPKSIPASKTKVVSKFPTAKGPNGKPVLDYGPAGDRMTTEWWDTLSNKQKNAWRDYTGPWYADINRALRTSQPTPQTSDRIKDLSETMIKIPETITVFRGASMSVSDFKVGGLWTDKGFMSTSVNPGSKFSRSVSFEITCPPGTRGMFIGHKSSHPHENEFLLDRGTRFRVTKIIGSKVYLTVIP